VIDWIDADLNAGQRPEDLVNRRSEPGIAEPPAQLATAW